MFAKIFVKFIPAIICCVNNVNFVIIDSNSNVTLLQQSKWTTLVQQHKSKNQIQIKIKPLKRSI